MKPRRKIWQEVVLMSQAAICAEQMAEGFSMAKPPKGTLQELRAQFTEVEYRLNQARLLIESLTPEDLPR